MLEVLLDYYTELTEKVGHNLANDPPRGDYQTVTQPDPQEVGSVGDPAIDELTVRLESIRALGEAIQVDETNWLERRRMGQRTT